MKRDERKTPLVVNVAFASREIVCALVHCFALAVSGEGKGKKNRNLAHMLFVIMIE